jgi:hypothetical protein
MYAAMTKLINKRFYATAEDAQNKLDVFFAVGRLTDVQYTELSAMIAETYSNV